ncbi:MAG: hypothetical protein V3T72_04615 [Thermoanaerobaculia bacterium]
MLANGHRLDVRHGRQVLLNPYVTAPVIEELVCNRRLMTKYEMRSAVARHRRTPQTAALRFISGLFWRDLLDIAADMRITPAVRRVAEKYLARRLERLTVGERTAVARRATPAVILQLRRDRHLHVFKALLDNPRLTEDSLLPAVSDQRAPPRILDLVAKNPRWGARYAIRRSLCRNPQSPFQVIFEMLPRLRRKHLFEIAELEEHSWIVRHRARELIAEQI